MLSAMDVVPPSPWLYPKLVFNKFQPKPTRRGQARIHTGVSKCVVRNPLKLSQQSCKTESQSSSATQIDSTAATAIDITASPANDNPAATAIDITASTANDNALPIHAARVDDDPIRSFDTVPAESIDLIVQYGQDLQDSFDGLIDRVENFFGRLGEDTPLAESIPTEWSYRAPQDQFPTQKYWFV